MIYYKYNGPKSVTYCNAENFVLILPMRTASRYIRSIFNKHFKIEHELNGNIIASPGYGHWPNFPDSFPKNYYGIMTVRNPYRRAASVYNWLGQIGKPGVKESFPECCFVFNPHSSLADYENAYKPEYHIRLESMQASLNKIPFKGITPEAITDEFVPDYEVVGGDWRKVYEKFPGSDKIILEKWREDFELFNYSTNIEDA